MLLVTEACANWLGDVQHVGDIVPAVGVIVRRQVVVQHARSILLKQTNKTVRAWTTIKPESKRVLIWVIAGLEEPVEDVDLCTVR